jgi:microcystin-dependent protein
LSTLKIPTARIFEPLLSPARYKAAFGGRGSGKSHFFGELLVETCQAERGTLAVCIREAQRTLSQSSKRLIESKIAALGIGSGFKLYSDKIETPGDGIIIFRGMQDHTADSIKSLEGFRVAWIDEAQNLSARSLSLLRPTIRAEGSELWASWNPYNVPLGAGMDYWGATAPNSAFAFPTGQTISRTTYATLFALIGTTYGTGNGSTTFNLPDKTGRVSAMKESAATRLVSADVGVDGGTLGSAGGGSQTLVTANLPPYTPAGTSATILVNTFPLGNIGGATVGNSISQGNNANASGGPLPLGAAGAFTGTPQGGTSTPIKIVQPTIICNYIMRII